MEQPLIHDTPGEYRTGGHLIAEILARPFWSFEDVSILVDIPVSTVRLIAKKTPIENGFLIGRQIRFPPDSVRAWWKQLQKENPYTPRKNNTCEAA